MFGQATRKGERTMNHSKELRRYPRQTAFIFAKYTVKEGAREDVITNISAGGLFVRTWKKVESGQAIVLEFPLFDFDSTIQVAGKIIRIEPTGFAVEFIKPIQGLICRKGFFPEIVDQSKT